MTSDRFLEMNILIYAALGKQDEPRKYEIARRIIAEERFGLSGQVLAEFYVGVTTKSAAPLTHDEAEQWLDRLAEFPVASIDGTLVRTAVTIARRYQIHYYDAAIVAAAERLGCPVLYSEDLDHGQSYSSVVVENPFRLLDP